MKIKVMVVVMLKVLIMVMVVMVVVKIMVMVLGTVWSFFCLMATIAQVLVTMVSRHTGKEKRRNDGSNI